MSNISFERAFEITDKELRLKIAEAVELRAEIDRLLRLKIAEAVQLRAEIDRLTTALGNARLYCNMAGRDLIDAALAGRKS